MNSLKLALGLCLLFFLNKAISQSAGKLSFYTGHFSAQPNHPVSATDLTNSWQAIAWKGERVHHQLLFSSGFEEGLVTLERSELMRSDGQKIDPSHIQISTMDLVLTDHIGNLSSGCGIPTGLDTSLVFDRITTNTKFRHSKHSNQAIWLSIDVPASTSPGLYKGTITAKGKTGIHQVPYEIEVSNQVLPPSDQWSYHLDLWQNPFATARYYQVEPWSQEHFDLLQPYMKKLASAGQKNITASIIYDPWNGQTYDIYQSMIQWTKTKQGTWRFDYTHFDNWVLFMKEMGINGYINCYSMIPWNLKFYYFDESDQQTKFIKASPEETAYAEHWSAFLQDFAKHLKEKGWFEQTTIAMDERPMEHMKAAIALIKAADQDFLISLAGGYHPEIADQLVDYSITLAEDMPEELLSQRKALGYKTTFYTCCTEAFPNTFTSSGYQEAVWLAWHSVQRGFDGYLRWAYDSWNAQPNQDARAGTWLAGDAWLIYPEQHSSIRFEKLIEGIQDAEKIKIVRKQLEESSRIEELHILNTHIASFTNKNIIQQDIPKQLNLAKSILNAIKK